MAAVAPGAVGPHAAFATAGLLDCWNAGLLDCWIAGWRYSDNEDWTCPKELDAPHQQEVV